MKPHIKTFGCQMNEYGCVKTVEVLRAAHGCDLTEDQAEADVLSRNQVGVTEVMLNSCRGRRAGETRPEAAPRAAAG